MDRLEFKGIQNTHKGDVYLEGYIQILPKEEEFQIPVKGLITINDGRNFTHDFTGSITQLIMSAPAKMTLYTKGNIGEKLYYRFEKTKFSSGKVTYSGIWCPLNQETMTVLVKMPIAIPENSKYAELEFILKNNDYLLLMEEIGLHR
jgi:hypothetical protein